MIKQNWENTALLMVIVLLNEKVFFRLRPPDRTVKLDKIIRKTLNPRYVFTSLVG